MDNADIILKAIIDILPKNELKSGEARQPKELYIPSAHKKALELHSSLVSGGRGVGKTTWTSALANPESRTIIGANVRELENAEVYVGFAENPNLSAYPDTDVFKSLLQKQFAPRDIWKTVVVRLLCQKADETMPLTDWTAGVSWVKDNPEQCARILEKANNFFKHENRNVLILFDALDRSCDNWEEMDRIVKELLQLVLYLKGYSHIHTKVFLREDQFSRNVTNFPDASKLKATMTELNWDLYDLHGLLWQLLCNAPEEGGRRLRNIYKEVTGLEPVIKDDYWIVNDGIKRDETLQRGLFEKLAGPWMGRDKRRGVPYLWSVGHLADGKKHTSPRSFLKLIRVAAEDSLNLHKRGEYLLPYESIKRAVRSASTTRVEEMAEDYPWVKDVCKPLERKNVPVDFEEIKSLWTQKYPGGPAGISQEKLPPQNMDKGWEGIKDELIRIGVFEEMRDGRINMPDLYRVGFGLGRKGGVPPINKNN